MQATYCPYCMKVVQTEICPHCGSNVNYPGDPMHLPVGIVLNGKHPYVLGACRGQGGFGVTYIALDAETNTRVAIKEYFPTYCSGRSGTEMIRSYRGQEEAYDKGKARFLDEARTVQSLNDLENVVQVLDFFECNNTAYMVMEFLDGCSLKEYVQNNGPIPSRQLLEQMKPLLCDMQTMHERGVIHRDIAPDNIILLPDGSLKLIDFGAARSYLSEKSMSVVVKKGFAPVEQYMRTGISASADVYAIAATIYYCITGIVPPDSADRQYGNVTLQSPSALGIALTREQEIALDKALQIQPMARTQSVAEFAQELNASYPKSEPEVSAPESKVEEIPSVAEHQEPVKSEPESQAIPEISSPDMKAGYTIKKKKPRFNRKFVAAAAGALLVAVAIIIFTYTGWLHIGGKYYYYKGGDKQTGHQYIDGSRYYFDNHGVMLTGWHTVLGEEYYYGTDGKMYLSWKTINGKRYYFGYDGVKRTGIQEIDGSTYYFSDEGIMQTGWHTLNNRKCYFNEEGVMQTGWSVIGDKTYFFDASGNMVSGWVNVENQLYYFNEDGTLQTGWTVLDGYTYYMDEFGHVMTGFQQINGSIYYFDEIGVQHQGWLEVNGKTYYCVPSRNNALAIGKWKIGDHYYYFLSDGARLTGNIELESGKIYYFDDNGRFKHYDTTIRRFNTTWSEDTVSFPNRGGGRSTSHYKIFDSKLENVISVDIELTMVSMEYGVPDGQWQVNVRKENGTWERIGLFDVKDGVGVLKGNLDNPVTFDAFVCCCYDGIYYSGSFYMEINSVTCRGYDFGTGVQTE